MKKVLFLLCFTFCALGVVNTIFAQSQENNLHDMNENNIFAKDFEDNFIDLSSTITPIQIFQTAQLFVDLIKADSADNHHFPPNHFYEKLTLVKANNFSGVAQYAIMYGPWGESKYITHIKLNSIEFHAIHVPWFTRDYQGVLSLEADVSTHCKKAFNIQVSVNGNSRFVNKMLTKDLTSYAEQLIVNLSKNSGLYEYCLH